MFDGFRLGLLHFLKDLFQSEAGVSNRANFYGVVPADFLGFNINLDEGCLLVSKVMPSYQEDESASAKRVPIARIRSACDV